MSILDHPGNLGAVRGTALSIHHADWPAYPQGEDYWTALLQLTVFPSEVEFIAADDIDRAILFFAAVPTADTQRPLDRRNFHIAVWHEDLIRLSALGWIVGPEAVTKNSWDIARWNAMAPRFPESTTFGFRTEDGSFTPIEPPSKEEFDEEWDEVDFAIVPSGRIRVTPDGRDAMSAELQRSDLDLFEVLGSKVEALYKMEYYDACVREACVSLEHDVRLIARCEHFGWKLVNAFFESLSQEGVYFQSHLRTSHQELRAIFTFIRNDFMHNMRDLDAVAARAILFRVARIRSVLLESGVGA